MYVVVVVVVIVAVGLLKSDCVGSLPNNVVEIVIAFEVISTGSVEV